MSNRTKYTQLADVTLKTIFHAMLYVAREEGEEVDDKYHKMLEHLITSNDLDVTDMVDNLENVYKALREVGVDENTDDEDDDVK